MVTGQRGIVSNNLLHLCLCTCCKHTQQNCKRDRSVQDSCWLHQLKHRSKYNQITNSTKPFYALLLCFFYFQTPVIKKLLFSHNQLKIWLKAPDPGQVSCKTVGPECQCLWGGFKSNSSVDNSILDSTYMNRHLTDMTFNLSLTVTVTWVSNI